MGNRPYSQYKILVQAFNQYGKGPMAKAKAYTLSDGECIIKNRKTDIEKCRRTEKKIERERETERQKAERQNGRKTERQKDRKAERQKDRKIYFVPVPSAAPSNVECKSLGTETGTGIKSGSTGTKTGSIQIRWLLLNQDQLRGKLIAYKIVFQDVDQIGSVNGKLKYKVKDKSILKKLKQY
jgi:hypothetical protein